MDADRWSLVKDRFFEALGLPLAERRRFLHHLDDATRSEVAALLEAAEPTSGPLDLPFDLSLLGIDLLGGTEAGRTEKVRNLSGARVGPYLIEEKIGQGGMGDVYRARRADGLFERVVALKLVRADTKTVLARFAAERRILGTLEHPGIARLIAAGSETEGPTAGRPWLALEYVDGVPLTEAVRDLELRERLRLVAEIAEAVHHAHRRLVVHRDLKPSNVLVVEQEDGTRRVKLLDFGIAKIVDPEADPGLTQIDGRSPRTRAYAAPEQVAGQPVTTATDVYGLGLLLFEVLTAARPFPIDRGLYALESAILQDDPPRPSAAAQPESGGLDPKRLHGDLDAICLKALAKEPEARYASAEAFAADLQRHLDGMPVEARVPSVRYRVRRFLARHRTAVAGAILIVASLVGGLGLAVRQTLLVQAKQAETAAALYEAEEVQSFLIDLLQGADPYLEASGSAYSRSLLERGLARAKEMNGQPTVQAEVYHAIGSVFLNLGEFERAEDILLQALALRRDALGRDHPDVAETLVLLSQAVRNLNRFVYAEDLARRALTILSPSDLPRTPSVAETLEHLGRTRVYRGDLDGAETLFREALVRRRAALGPDHHSLGETLRLIASTMRRMGRHDEAAEHYAQALRQLQRSRGPDHPHTAWFMAHLGDQYAHMGREQEAEDLFVSGLRILRSAYEEGHPRMIHSINSLASLHKRHSRWNAAEALYREGVDIANRFFGTTSWRAGHALIVYADYLRDRHRYTEAEHTLLEALTIMQSDFEPSHRRVLSVRSALGLTYQARGELARAEAEFRDILNARSSAEGPESHLTAVDRRMLADVVRIQGNHEEAEDLYLEALAIYRQSFPDGHEGVQTTLRGLVRLYEETSRDEAAAVYRLRLRRAHDVR